VHVLELSNHPRALLAKAAAPRLAAEAEAKEKWQRAKAGREQRIEQLRDERAQARTTLRPDRWLLAVLKHAAVLLSGAPPAPRPLMPSDDEHAKAAGVQGEDGVLLALCERLGEDWQALSGYRNRAGEIDLVLLGPRGVFALEVKNNNATVVCDGDSWFYEQYDKYGNPVKEGTISDKQGRSPSQQLNEPADQLASVLAPSCPGLWIKRIVVLCHPRGWVDVDRSSNFTVAVANDIDFVIKLIAESEARFSPEKLAELREAIVADHRRHNRRPVGRR
jgi:Nuclease-related domain